MVNTIYIDDGKETKPEDAREEISKRFSNISKEEASKFLIEQGHITQEFIDLMKKHSVLILDELIKKHNAKDVYLALPNFVVNASPALMVQIWIFKSKEKTPKELLIELVHDMTKTTIKAMQMNEEDIINHINSMNSMNNMDNTNNMDNMKEEKD